jgi:hypothetical protein
VIRADESTIQLKSPQTVQNLVMSHHYAGCTWSRHAVTRDTCIKVAVGGAFLTYQDGLVVLDACAGPTEGTHLII